MSLLPKNQQPLFTIAERRLVVVFVPLLLYALYQWFSPVSYYHTGDIYQEPEATLTVILFYITVVFSMMWLRLVVRERNLPSILLFWVLGGTSLVMYVSIAMTIFSLG